MRASSYIIRTPLRDGRFILVHGYSGAVDVVQRPVVDFLDAAGEEAVPTPRPAEAAVGLSEQDVAALKARGYLTDKTEEEEQETISAIARALHRQSSVSNGSGVIIPTFDCNLRCVYCYERQLSGRGRRWLARTMTHDMVDAAYAVLDDLARRSEAEEQTKRYPRQITLLGGEPLLAKNRELVQYIISEGVKRGCLFSVITNGTELDAFLPDLTKADVRYVQVTLDGSREHHDRRRFGPRREGSFDRIVSNVHRALEAGVTLVVRVNVDGTNIADLPGLAELAASEGWGSFPSFHMHCSPVYTGAGRCRIDDSVALTDVQLEAALAGLREAVPSLAVIKHAPSVKNVFMNLFKSGEYLAFRGHFCGASGSMMIFDPHGDIYACWESVGRPVGKIGSYSPALTYDEENMGRWRGRTVTEVPACRVCKYALLCGGGCPQHACNTSGSFLEPYCNDFGEMLTTGLPVFYQEFLDQATPPAGEPGTSPDLPA